MSNDSWKTQTIEDELDVQQCDACSNPYAIAYSPKLGKWIFVCLNCGVSCGTLVTEEGEEIEIK